MKFAAFAVLLVISSVYAASVQVDVASNRMVNLVVQDWINRYVDRARQYDPLHIEERDIHYVVIPREAEVIAKIQDLKLFGAAGIEVVKLNYNILWGILEYHVYFSQLSLSLGGSDIHFKYGDAQGSGAASGSLEITNFGLKGTAHLYYDYAGEAHINYITPELVLGSINANFKIASKTQDYSDQVNKFLNSGILDLYNKYRLEANTMLGEGMKMGVNWWRNRN